MKMKAKHPIIGDTISTIIIWIVWIAAVVFLSSRLLSLAGFDMWD